MPSNAPIHLRRLVAICLLIAGLAFSTTATAGEIERLSGSLQVLWGDPMPDFGLAGHHRIMLAADGGELVELEISAALVGQAYRWQGRRVTAVVERSDDASPPRVRSLRAQGPAAGTPAAGTPAAGAPAGGARKRGGVLGSQPWVSILCKFSNIAAEPEDLAFFQGMYANAPGGLDHYWREVSYDAIDVVGSTAVDWVTLPNPQTFYVPTPGSGTSANLAALFNDCTAAADPFIDYSRGGDPFVGINLMFNGLLDCCAWGGSFFAVLDGVAKSWRSTWNPPWAFTQEAVIAHEMGHGFGLPHSNNWDNDGNPYDSPWDVMSSATGYAVSDPVYGPLGKHVHAQHKDILGWIPPAERFEMPDDSVRTIVLDPLAQASTANYRIALIPIPASISFYAVEARDLLGNYDGNVPGHAVIITEVLNTRSEPVWVVDSDVPPAGYGDNEGSMWRAGETFVDAANEIQIEVLGVVGDGFEIRIGTGNTGLIFSDGFESGDTTAWSS